MTAHSPSSCHPLTGLRVVTLAANLPGPLAASRLQQMGAAVTKIEAPAGDPFLRYSAEWYAEMRRGQTVLTLNLKSPDDRAQLDALLTDADLLITSNRPAALARLNLDWPTLHATYPRLCQVAILGHNPPDENRPGHDLTYQSDSGLLTPPHMPRTLLADLAGAERTVSLALSLLLCAQRGHEGQYAEIALAEAVHHFAAPLRYGLTAPGGFLGGGFSGYNLYRTADGWITLAALEPHFWERCRTELNLEAEAEYEAFAEIFAKQSTAHWVAWAEKHDVPMAPLG
ncbi:MAG: CoA transferase [Anaerolineales bacterium]|nr:CoA transferase [Anaerolineales bacterium]